MTEKIEQLLKENIYLGTSSWKYEGWKGLVFKREYRSKKAFAETCLEEYAETYSCVGVDHTYYDWPKESAFLRYAEQTPPSFRFALKATEEITAFKYPKLPRYGKRSGVDNENFLNAELFRAKFLEPLLPVKERVGLIMLEFSHFYPGQIGSGREFVERLDRFFSAVGDRTGFPFGVEIRNQNWLEPPYFKVLEKHGATHVINSWTRMPTVGEQLAALEPYRLPMLVARLLLQPGTKYADAVLAFSPYNKIIEPSDAIRAQGAAVIRRARELKIPAFVLVNNRCEGCAPKTIEGILERV